jgi:hypothetical protein
MKALVSLFGIATIVLFGLSSVPAYADNTSFLAKMQKFAGRNLNGDELKQVLIGNSLKRVHQGRGAKSRKWRTAYWYYKDEKNVRLTTTNENAGDLDSTWSVTKEGTYCHVSRIENASYCKRFTKIVIEDGKAKVTQTNKDGEGRQELILLEGRHEAGS